MPIVETAAVGPCANCGAELTRWPDGKLTSAPSLSRWCGDEHDGHEISCGAVYEDQPPCGKPSGHEHGPTTDWKRGFHSNGYLKWPIST
jgi:hypothetical protein